ncbi:MAG TPA: hypothetical protein VHB98_19145 [Chloroflexota bacterium]|nr:hypothetical protein [Chloroflexota bacterium]
MADQARQQVSTQLNSQKDRATSTLDSVAQALRQTGQQLQDQGQAPIAGYTTKAAEQVERVTRYLNERDVTDLQGDAARLARTQPVLFVAGAFALGWLGARFFKSAAPAQAAGQNGASTMRPALPSSTPDISYAGMQADTWTDTADVSAQDSALAQPRSVTRSSSAL